MRPKQRDAHVLTPEQRDRLLTAIETFPTGDVKSPDVMSLTNLWLSLKPPRHPLRSQYVYLRVVGQQHIALHAMRKLALMTRWGKATG